MPLASLVALVDFTADDGEQFFAGISHVSVGHEYVRRYPGKFGPATRARSKTWPGTRSRSAGATTRRSAEPLRGQPKDPEIRSGYRLHMPTVHFELHALQVLRNQALWDGREHGGGLYGHVHGSTIHVVDVCGRAAIKNGNPDHLLLDIDGISEWAQRTGFDWVGDWHSHRKYEEGGPLPSVTDLKAWSAGFRLYGRNYAEPAFVGMIVAPSAPPQVDADPWFPPAQAAWVVRYDDGEQVIDPARLEFEHEL